jgi:hypothetical protein
MNKLILLAVIASSILNSCSPKSYCFFNTKERLFYISDKNGDSIRAITVISTEALQSFKRNIELNPITKSYKIVEDSIINQNIYVFITTNNIARYSLKLRAEDWSNDTVLKCRYLIR